MLGTLTTTLIPLLPTVLRFAESLFPAPKSGPDKLSLVRSILRAVADKLTATQPSLPKPTDDALDSIIEAALAQLKLTSGLSEPLPTATTVLLITGTVRQVPITPPPAV